MTTATIATTPKNTTPTTFRSICGFALTSMQHSNSLSYSKFPPPPCAVLLVQTPYIYIYMYVMCAFIRIGMMIQPAFFSSRGVESANFCQFLPPVRCAASRPIAMTGTCGCSTLRRRVGFMAGVSERVYGPVFDDLLKRNGEQMGIYGKYMGIYINRI